MSTRLEVLERNLTRAFARYHADAQIRRVVSMFIGTFVMQLLTGFHDWTWKGLLALAAAVGYGVLRKLYPTVSWKLVLHHLNIQLAQEPVPVLDATVPPTTASGPPADQVYTPVTQPTVRPPGS